MTKSVEARHPEPAPEPDNDCNAEFRSKAFEVPAIATNVFYVQVTPDAASVRLAFAEQWSERGVLFRTAVTLPLVDALELSNVLRELLTCDGGTVN